MVCCLQLLTESAHQSQVVSSDHLSVSSLVSINNVVLLCVQLGQCLSLALGQSDPHLLVGLHLLLLDQPDDSQNAPPRP